MKHTTPALLVLAFPFFAGTLAAQGAKQKAGAAGAAGDGQPLVQDAAKTWAPSKVPDRIILTWAEAPATSQSVTWRTDATVDNGIVEWAVATDGPEFVAQREAVAATTTEFRSDLGVACYHSTTIRGLTPATRYVYRVGDGHNWSEWSHFTTANDAPTPFSFIYFGDAQNDLKSHWGRVAREAFRDAPRAAFLLHAGDLVNQGNHDAEWGEWFYSAGWILRTVPSIATPGNHEYANRRLSRHWRPVFAFPEHGPEGLEETVYAIDYQGARIVSLDSNRPLPAQVEWFEKTMQESTARWTIVTMHHPVFSTARNRDNPKLRDTLQPLFDRHAIDLVLQGHDHTYGRTGRMRHTHAGVEHVHQAAIGSRPKVEDRGVEDRGVEGRAVEGRGVEDNVPTGVMARSEESGTVYVVSVSGPKLYKLDRKPFMQKAVANKQLYQVVSVDGDTLRYSAHTATGALFDSFELRKVDGQPNRLIERRRSVR